jgi:Protein of unknown function (DUF3997)
LLGSHVNTTISRQIKNDRNFEDVILGEIVGYDFDKRFILIQRNASDEAKDFFRDHPLWKNQVGKTANQYWIIDKDDDKVYGPLDSLQFLSQRDALKISSALQFNP